jgi:hypothetical protein
MKNLQNFITADDLLSLGVQLNDSEMEKLLEMLNEKVATLIAEEIIESLTPDDADKLVKMQESASDQELGQWIAEHVPDYPEIIDNNTDIVIGDFIEGKLDQE